MDRGWKIFMGAMRGAFLGFAIAMFLIALRSGDEASEWVATIWGICIVIQCGTIVHFHQRRRASVSETAGWREHEAGRDRGDHHDSDPDEGAGHDAGERSLVSRITRLTGPGEDARARTSVEPVVAYKVGRLGGDAVTYSGVQGSAMSTEFIAAECNSGRTHKVPDKDCTCGHYACALPNHSRLSSVSGHSVLFRVELAGTVLADGEGVYRASHQRIMGCYVSTVCSVCGVEATSELARPDMDVPESDAHLSWIPLCERCTKVIDRAQPIKRMSLVDAQGYFGMEVERVPFDGWAIK